MKEQKKDRYSVFCNILANMLLKSLFSDNRLPENTGNASDLPSRTMASPLISVKIRPSGQFPNMCRFPSLTIGRTSEEDVKGAAELRGTNNENFILDFRLGKEHKVCAAIEIISYQLNCCYLKPPLLGKSVQLHQFMLFQYI